MAIMIRLGLIFDVEKHEKHVSDYETRATLLSIQQDKVTITQLNPQYIASV